MAWTDLISCGNPSVFLTSFNVEGTTYSGDDESKVLRLVEVLHGGVYNMMVKRPSSAETLHFGNSPNVFGYVFSKRRARSGSFKRDVIFVITA